VPVNAPAEARIQIASQQFALTHVSPAVKTDIGKSSILSIAPREGITTTNSPQRQILIPLEINPTGNRARIASQPNETPNFTSRPYSTPTVTIETPAAPSANVPIAPGSTREPLVEMLPSTTPDPTALPSVGTNNSAGAPSVELLPPNTPEPTFTQPNNPPSNNTARSSAPIVELLPPNTPEPTFTQPPTTTARSSNNPSNNIPNNTARNSAPIVELLPPDTPEPTFTQPNNTTSAPAVEMLPPNTPLPQFAQPTSRNIPATIVPTAPTTARSPIVEPISPVPAIPTNNPNIAQSGELPGITTPPATNSVNPRYNNSLPLQPSYVGPIFAFGRVGSGVGVGARFPIARSLSARPSLSFGNGGTRLNAAVSYDFGIGRDEPFEANPLFRYYLGGGLSYTSGDNKSTFNPLLVFGTDINLNEGMTLNGEINTNFDGTGGSIGLGFHF
jgi:hypothetical protein